MQRHVDEKTTKETRESNFDCKWNVKLKCIACDGKRRRRHRRRRCRRRRRNASRKCIERNCNQQLSFKIQWLIIYRLSFSISQLIVTGSDCTFAFAICLARTRLHVNISHRRLQLIDWQCQLTLDSTDGHRHCRLGHIRCTVHVRSRTHTFKSK